MKTFKEFISKDNLDKITESMNTDDMLEELMDLVGTKADQDMWDWFMDNMGDSGIVASNAVSEDYLEKMDKNQTKSLYKAMKKYL